MLVGTRSPSDVLEPLIAEGHVDPYDDDVQVDVGGFSAMADDDAMISDVYIRGSWNTSITIPWETDLMRHIFSDSVPAPSVSMPLNWGSTALPSAAATEDKPAKPQIPEGCVWTCAKHIKYTSDDNFLVQRSKTMPTALPKWRFILALDFDQSEVGRQLNGVDSMDVVLQSVIGVKSPNTVLKRANSILMYYRWHAVHGNDPFLPFSESDTWAYVISQQGIAGSHKPSFKH